MSRSKLVWINCYFYFFVIVAVIADKASGNLNDSSSYRLPKTILPESYDLLILPRVTQGITSYQGQLNLTISVVNETRKIVLHSDGLKILHEKSTIRSVTNGNHNNLVGINDQVHIKGAQFFIILTSRNLERGKYVLSLHFEGELRDGVVGFYRSSYIFEKKKRWAGVTQFSPIFARRAFPCMDEPGFKANFQISIGHLGNETISSNTFPKWKNVTSEKNYYITTFSRTPRMSTYLVAWAVHGFNRVQSKQDPRYSLWSRHTTRPDSLAKSLSLMEIPKIHSVLRNWTGIDDPVDKFEQLAVPDFLFGAMENWGLVTSRESMVLPAQNESPLISIRNNIIAMAHEYAHTWFGNLVTPDYWNVVWLKEGFATYFAHLAVGMLHKDWHAMDMFSVNVMQASLTSDSIKYNRTLNARDVGSPTSVMGVIDLLNYNKGASIVRMIADIVGGTTFQKAMRSLLKEKLYQSITQIDLYKHLDSAIASSGRSSKIPATIGEIVETWTNQPNFPLINVTRSSRKELKRKLELSQVPFQLNQSQLEPTDNRAWWVPITLAVSQGTKNSLTEFSTWLTPHRGPQMMDLPPDATWYLLNPRLIGYYRVKYDVENWQALIRTLDSEKYRMIPAIGRAGLIDDVFNLARAGYENYSLALDLIKYLPRETEYEPWLAASKALQFLDRNILRERPEIRAKFRKFASRLISRAYVRFKFNEASRDSHIDKLHRSLVVSTTCALDYGDCVKQSKKVFHDWILNQSIPIHANLRNVVYSTAVAHGDYKDWLHLWGVFLKSDSHSEIEILMGGLAQTKNSSLIRKYFEYAISPDSHLPHQYRSVAIQSIISSGSGNTNTVLEFITDNLNSDKLLQLLSTVIQIIPIVGSESTSAEQLKRLITFSKKLELHLGSTVGIVHRAIKDAKQNIEWVDRCASQISLGLDRKAFI